jgi:ABC-type Mn2+/Zn2+ transport system permease subunit
VAQRVLAIVALFFKEFLFITFDPEMAQVSGIPARAMYLLLLSITALTVVVSIKVVGIILVSAMIVVPAASAYQLTEDFRTMMAVAVLIGNASAIGGLLLSYRLNTASGATMVLTATAVFFVSTLLSPRRRRGGNR